MTHLHEPSELSVAVAPRIVGQVSDHGTEADESVSSPTRLELGALLLLTVTHPDIRGVGSPFHCLGRLSCHEGEQGQHEGEDGGVKEHVG